MTFKRCYTTDNKKEDERRSGLNRRWIKAPYDGVERRRGSDRRHEFPPEPTADIAGSEAGRTESIEKLLLSTTVRLEALARLLVEKGVLSHEELADMLNTMQAEYRPRKLKGD
ncbi:MAG: hypothetical protein MUC33_13155 [Desulfobacterales bacterium]|jgi:hypothetical protein|nr:hypothetical protein [Desulfobacterales bacterium]